MPPHPPSLLRASVTLSGAVIVGSLVGQALEARPLGAVLVAAFAVDALTAKLGAGWHEGPTEGLSGRFFGLGLAIGASAVLVTALVGLGAGLASFHHAPVDLLGLAIAAVAAVAAATRDEQLWRWLPRRLFASSMGPRGALAFSLALGLAGAVGAGARSPTTLALALAQGLLANALLVRTGGLAAPIGAAAGLHLACALATSTLEARWTRGSLASPTLATGPGALLLALLLAAAALVAWRARGAPVGPPPAPDRGPRG